ncbi:unnamed protein product, partial [Rotaria magnacalcarata]
APIAVPAAAPAPRAPTEAALIPPPIIAGLGVSIYILFNLNLTS